MKSLSLMLVTVVAAIHAPTTSMAATPDPNLGRNLAATCANCHGTDGKSVGGMETLAGLPKEKIVESMKAFKIGERQATVMHQLSKGYSDAQIEAIAAFLSAQKQEGRHD